VTLRSLRLIVLFAVTALTSGVPHVVAAAMDDDCCTESCDGVDGKRCPPNCDSELCAKAFASLGAVLPPCLSPRPVTARSVAVAEACPELPLVVTGVFQPPRA
jgi:hypothetical protein